MSEKNITTSPQRRKGQRLTAKEQSELKTKFLDAFGRTANVLAACQATGIDRSTVYRWKEHDEDFMLRFHLASEDANDRIRAELYRRAIVGVERPVVSMGRVVEDKNGQPLMMKEYSDSLLSLLAKARMPEFREKQQIDMNASIKIVTQWGNGVLEEDEKHERYT